MATAAAAPDVPGFNPLTNTVHVVDALGSAATPHDEADIAASITLLLKLPPDVEAPVFAGHRRPPVSRTVSEDSVGSTDER